MTEKNEHRGQRTSLLVHQSRLTSRTPFRASRRRFIALFVATFISLGVAVGAGGSLRADLCGGAAFVVSAVALWIMLPPRHSDGSDLGAEEESQAIACVTASILAFGSFTWIALWHVSGQVLHGTVSTFARIDLSRGFDAIGAVASVHDISLLSTVILWGCEVAFLILLCAFILTVIALMERVLRGRLFEKATVQLLTAASVISLMLCAPVCFFAFGSAMAVASLGLTSKGGGVSSPLLPIVVFYLLTIIFGSFGLAVRKGTALKDDQEGLV